MNQSSFSSILFLDPVEGEDVDTPGSPQFFGDLNLDRVLEALTEGAEEYNLGPLFCYPLSDIGSIAYRHDVMRDLEAGPLRGHVEAFAESMRSMRLHLSQADKLSYEYQKMSWFLDAVEIYCDAVKNLLGGLSQEGPTSRGLQSFAAFLEQYSSSPEFVGLVSETKRLKRELSGITYRVHIQGRLVSVGRYGGEPDYSSEVEETFRRFAEGAVGEYAMRGQPRQNGAGMDSVEEQVMGLVAKLYPELFGGLAAFYARHAAYLDQTIGRFDREVQFYLVYIRLMERLRSGGLSFCYPQVGESKSVRAADAFDLALAIKLVHEGSTVVCNDFFLEGEERIFVVSGPNQGGKTTFARTFGQLHYIARLGLPVPGKEARLLLSDGLFTHFEREEHIEDLRGKLQDELLRMHGVLQRATGDSVVIVNEGFASTSVNDALYIGREILRQVADRGCLCVYVTFVDELSRLGKATVSMVSTVVPEDPTQRTFKVVRRPADGRAYAMAIAEKYGLTRQALRERASR